MPNSFSHVQPAVATLPGASLLWCMVAEGPGLPFGFPTWTAVLTTAGIWFFNGSLEEHASDRDALVGGG